MTKADKIATPAQVYELPIQRETINLNEIFGGNVVGFQEVNGCYYQHMPEVDSFCTELKFPEDAICLKLKVHKFFDFDGRRFWRLSSLWFLGNPFMIMQNAGREGDDHAKRYITDAKMYARAHNYVNSSIIYDADTDVAGDVVDINTVIGDELTTFYGNSLNGHFERY